MKTGDTLRECLDPNRSLEGWLREKQGWSAEDVAILRNDFGQWLDAMRLRQGDPEVRAAQNKRWHSYMLAKQAEDSREERRRLVEKAKR